jgi:hypothetical protein
MERIAVTQDPVSMQLIRERLAAGDYYLTLDIFVADFHRMFANARFYNSAESIFFKLANKLEDKLEAYLEVHVLRDAL